MEAVQGAVADSATIDAAMMRAAGVVVKPDPGISALEATDAATEAAAAAAIAASMLAMESAGAGSGGSEAEAAAAAAAAAMSPPTSQPSMQASSASTVPVLYSSVPTPAPPQLSPGGSEGSSVGMVRAVPVATTNQSPDRTIVIKTAGDVATAVTIKQEHVYDAYMMLTPDANLAGSAELNVAAARAAASALAGTKHLDPSVAQIIAAAAAKAAREAARSVIAS